MGANTQIQWTWRTLPNGVIISGMSWNPWWGCLKVSEECAHCYAEDIAKHYGHHVWGPEANTSRRFFGEKHWLEPLKWNRQARQEGHRRSVFCASMADVYERYEGLDEQRQKLWKLIDATPWLNWLLLTKRPENILSMSPYVWWHEGFPDNVWVGTSVGTQKRAEERIPSLLEVPAVVRFLSCEPLLEEVNILPWLSLIDWVICGGESGAEHRPFNLDWARYLRYQCIVTETPFFFKQIGGRTHTSGGRDLDGRTWDELPPEVPSAERLIAIRG